jgi:hypothetical protein
MKFKLIGLTVLLAFAIPCKNVAQNVSKADEKPDYKVSLLENRSVNIEFDTDKTLSNILIIIVDDLGNTVFLDNQHDFKGTYKCSVDMSTYSKGNYYVRIKTDEEEKQTKLSIR